MEHLEHGNVNTWLAYVKGLKVLIELFFQLFCRFKIFQKKNWGEKFLEEKQLVNPHIFSQQTPGRRLGVHRTKTLGTLTFREEGLHRI